MRSLKHYSMLLEGPQCGPFDNPEPNVRMMKSFIRLQLTNETENLTRAD